MAFLEKSSPSFREGAKDALQWFVGGRLRDVDDADARGAAGYCLRDARRDDLRWALALNTRSYKDLVISQFGVWDASDQERRFLERWETGGLKLVMRRNVRAGLLFIETRKTCIWVGDIQIAPRWRGGGLAQAIFGDILVDARQNGLPVRLRIHHLNIRAKIAYDRLGFTPTHEDADFVYMQHD